MTVEVRPLGVSCNLGCQYCYQNPQRDAGNAGREYDLEAMKAALEREGRPFSLFGGEPLLLPKRDLEELWKFGLQRFGQNSVQTNGSLIDDEHVQLFKLYQVRVGISIDGPGELNDARWAGTLEATRAATERTVSAIEKLSAEGIPPSLIVTLHRGNAAADRLPVLHAFIESMHALGVRSIRLHLLEVDGPEIAAKYALTPAENIDAALSFLSLEERRPELRFDLFREMQAMLLGRDQESTCVWRACDPYTTSAVRGVEGRGQRSNCGRTNKDGVDFVKSRAPGHERTLALYRTPQEYGGCRGCRFFLFCKGQCPGTAIGGDWRNRSEHCESWKGIFRFLENRLVQGGQLPISLQPNRAFLEREMVAAWERGEDPGLQETLRRMGERKPSEAQR
jgi:uncharacterized protein